MEAQEREILCPFCNGTGNGSGIDGLCNCCRGSGRTEPRYVAAYEQHVRDLDEHRSRRRRR